MPSSAEPRGSEAPANPRRGLERAARQAEARGRIPVEFGDDPRAPPAPGGEVQGCLLDFPDLRGGEVFGPDQPSECCRKRQLSFPVSQWCAGRSSRAAVIFPSPNTDGHSENDRLVVTITDVRS